MLREEYGMFRLKLYPDRLACLGPQAANREASWRGRESPTRHTCIICTVATTCPALQTPHRLLVTPLYLGCAPTFTYGNKPYFNYKLLSFFSSLISIFSKFSCT